MRDKLRFGFYFDYELATFIFLANIFLKPQQRRGQNISSPCFEDSREHVTRQRLRNFRKYASHGEH